MGKLAIQDASWLIIESPERPMHVGGLVLFTPPPDAAPDWLQGVVEQALEHRTPRPPLNRKLRHPYGRLGYFEWVDADVDLTYHVRHLALPKPGRVRELLSLVSRLHGALLDRHRPLWELYLIEGLADGRVALYGKFHHSLMDGVAAVRQLLTSFSPDADERDMPPPWAAQGGQAAAGDPTLDPLGHLRRTIGGATRSLSGLLRQAASGVGVTRAFADQLVAKLSHEAEAIPFQAPPSMLNQPATSSRRFVAQSYDLDRLRAVAAATGRTVNDVVLTLCGGALRAYLAQHDALPERPLIALVPVNIRDDDTDEGNAITFLLANLATHLADPLERLEVVHESMRSGKERLAAMSRTARQNYGLTLAAPLVLGQLTGLSTRMPPLYNVVISNVPGPQEPLYWNGARLDGLYPLSIVADGFSLNITQTSYAGQMEFGFTADRQALPSVQRLIDHVEEVLAALEEATGTG